MYHHLSISPPDYNFDRSSAQTHLLRGVRQPATCVGASSTPVKVLLASNRYKPFGLRSSRKQPVTSLQGAATNSNSSAPSPAPTTTADAPWFGVPTRPGPDLEDGADYHDFFGFNKLCHIAASLAGAVLFLAVGLLYLHDSRWQMVFYCLAFVASLALECWQHHSMDSMHSVHSRLMPGNMAIIAAFVVLGGVKAMLAGPRDLLFYLGFCFLLPFSIYSTLAAYVMSLWRLVPASNGTQAHATWSS
ncbi:hypothetical protein WJX72_012267 [[Myrmecia] bisecta]|uniref:Uncharacterized protein n=1 Tax=[Myrmecia] bisecta TaxID=41462 RepID=A0AAW1RAQ0_9CHLO